MDFDLPDRLAGGTFAIGARVTSSVEIITLDFVIDETPGRYQIVQRVRLPPSALEPLYLELGAIIGQRREAEGEPDGT